MVGGEETRVLEGSIDCAVCQTAAVEDHDTLMGSNIPPTRVSWAPRRMALGSKLDTSKLAMSILSMAGSLSRQSGKQCSGLTRARSKSSVHTYVVAPRRPRLCVLCERLRTGGADDEHGATATMYGAPAPAPSPLQVPCSAVANAGHARCHVCIYSLCSLYMHFHQSCPLILRCGSCQRRGVAAAMGRPG